MVTKQDDVETTPEVNNQEDIPEIKVVQASPEMKVKSTGEGKEEEEKKVENVEDDKKGKYDSTEEDKGKNEDVVKGEFPFWITIFYVYCITNYTVLFTTPHTPQ